MVITIDIGMESYYMQLYSLSTPHIHVHDTLMNPNRQPLLHPDLPGAVSVCDGFEVVVVTASVQREPDPNNTRSEKTNTNSKIYFVILITGCF